MAAAVEKKYTWRDLVNMPDDGVERWLVQGQLREKPSEIEGASMTVRNRFHSDVMSGITTALKNWSRTRPKPWGRVLSGEAGIILPTSPDDSVGLDVGYIAPDVAIRQNDATTLLFGVPTLCVEILSPNDTVEQIDEKTDLYLKAGVPIVWIVNPYDQTVVIHRPDGEPDLYNITRRIPEHPAMPGFSPTVAELFE